MKETAEVVVEFGGEFPLTRDIAVLVDGKLFPAAFVGIELDANDNQTLTLKVPLRRVQIKLRE